MSYLRHILCCVFVLFFIVFMCPVLPVSLDCPFWLPLRCYLTFIIYRTRCQKYRNMTFRHRQFLFHVIQMYYAVFCGDLVVQFNLQFSVQCFVNHCVVCPFIFGFLVAYVGIFKLIRNRTIHYLLDHPVHHAPPCLRRCCHGCTLMFIKSFHCGQMYFIVCSFLCDLKKRVLFIKSFHCIHYDDLYLTVCSHIHACIIYSYSLYIYYIYVYFLIEVSKSFGDYS